MTMTALRSFVLALMATTVDASLPQFVVDLDVEPEERWRGVIQYYIDSGIRDAMMVDMDFGSGLPEEIKDEWMDVAERQFDEEYLREVDGFVKYGNISKKMFLQYAVGYEMNYPSYACSGLLAALPNGTVIHGRNMDYGGLTFILNGHEAGWPDVTIEITFVRDGKPLYTSINWPGQLGVHTAMRFDGWTFEQNTRLTEHDMQQNLAAARQGGHSFALYVRRLMERVPDFETAYETLRSEKFMSTQYFVMSGPKPYQGAVLSIDRMGQHLPGTPVTTLSHVHFQNNSWHIIQTNDDIGETPLDPRRPMEEMFLSTSSQSEVSVNWVFGHMRGPALFNPTTAFTWVAIPATNFHQTLLSTEPWSEGPAESQQRTAMTLLAKGSRRTFKRHEHRDRI